MRRNRLIRPFLHQTKSLCLKPNQDIPLQIDREPHTSPTHSPICSQQNLSLFCPCYGWALLGQLLHPFGVLAFITKTLIPLAG